jgi:hypothetical protein
MPVLRAGLMWQHHEFLGTDTIRVYVRDDLEASLLEFSQAEIRHLETGSLLGREHSPGLFEHLYGAFYDRFILLLGNHLLFPLSIIYQLFAARGRVRGIGGNPAWPDGPQKAESRCS